MKNFQQLLNLLVIREVITLDQANEIKQITSEEFPNTDLIKDEINLFDGISGVDEKIVPVVQQVLTFREAAELYNLDKTTLLQKQRRNNINPTEVRKSKGTWLISKKEMIRLYGNVTQKNENE